MSKFLDAYVEIQNNCTYDTLRSLTAGPHKDYVLEFINAFCENDYQLPNHKDVLLSFISSELAVLLQLDEMKLVETLSFHFKDHIRYFIDNSYGYPSFQLGLIRKLEGSDVSAEMDLLMVELTAKLTYDKVC